MSQEKDETISTPKNDYYLNTSPRITGGETSSTTTQDDMNESLLGKGKKNPKKNDSLKEETKEEEDDYELDKLECELVEEIRLSKKHSNLPDIGEKNDEDDGSDDEKGGNQKKKKKNDDDNEVYRYIHLNQPEENKKMGYCCNTVITSRFTIYNFIPKLLFYEFSKLANAYFLMISIMQTIKPISNTGGFPATLPALSIIVLIDMSFACMEDYKRHKADHISNNMTTLKFNITKKDFETAKWHELHVGDIVKIYNREPVPADLVILGAFEPEPSSPAGICYVETKSLDGETNLKLRQGLECTYTTIKKQEQLADLRGVVVCETPNNAIHRFNGTMSLKGGDKEVITTNAIILRGSTLRNTEYVYALVINTGPDTKIMMASSDIPMKWSNMERRLNRQILYICTLMVVLCITGATASTVWNHFNLGKTATEEAWYLFDPDATALKSPAGNFVILLFYYFLLLNSFIPVSLYVSMTSVKFMQSYFMNNDLDMYHEETDTPCQVRTMSLNEELGQIDYIFSDKTGTLTCNVMEFRKCSINGVAYGIGETEIGIAARKRRMQEQHHVVIMEDDTKDAKQHRVVQAPFVNYQDDAIFDALNQKDNIQSKLIHEFWEHLAVCHTVMPEKASDGTLRLSASSPDEQALVAAAACFGYKFCARSPGKAMVDQFSCLDPSHDFAAVNSPSDAVLGEYSILEVLEFNSTRKRMSVILEDPKGNLKVFCKGADTVMYERLVITQDPNILGVRNKTLEHMEMFASEGLRTLVIASRDLERSFYEKWVVKYRTAINDMRQIEMRRLGEVNDIDRLMEELEVNFEILGATAIEDRLQAEVPSTIARLREASIKIWMLTGDKEETAINIGFACRLLTSDIERVVISGDTHPDLTAIMEELDRYSSKENEGIPLLKGDTPQPNRTAEMDSELKVPLRAEEVPPIVAPKSEQNLALVIDGETLEVALDRCPMLLLDVAQRCCVVIACRVSPAQKAQLVSLVRENNPKIRTLAIGDGANDVSMIQCAHVGVGISGQEGMQAANTADYAIAQFRFLSKLLLVHGRWNYTRMGKLILYIFYKNVMMNLTQYWYMIFTGFSGQKFFLEWGLQAYNLIFTALPIILVATFEQDVPAYLAEYYPRLYRIGQENKHFNTKVVWAWITSCAWESVIISFGTLFGMKQLNERGETPNMWVYGCVAFTIVVLVVTLKLAIHQQMWWMIHVPVYVVSPALWIAVAALISMGTSISSGYWNGVFEESFGSRSFWLLMPLLTFTALSRDLYWKGYIRAFHVSYKHLAQEVHAYKLQHLAHKLLAFPPPEKIPAEAEALEGGERSVPVVETEHSGFGSVTVADTITIPPKGTAAKTGPKGSTHGARRGSVVNRGTAFSYDAESVMVESFIATERYLDAHEAKGVFERHASRGSLAFQCLPDQEILLPAPDTPGSSLRRASAGNVFARAARHSFGLQRFSSSSNVQNGGESDTSTPTSRDRTNSIGSDRRPRSHSGRGGSNEPSVTEGGRNSHTNSSQLVRRYTATKLDRKMSA